MPWFRAVMTAWVYERAKRHMSRKTEAYQPFQLDIGPGTYERVFLTHRNAVVTAVTRVAGMSCATEGGTEWKRREMKNVIVVVC